MYIYFYDKTIEQLYKLLQDDQTNRSQRKLIIQLINDNSTLIGAVVYIPSDNHPHYIKTMDDNKNLGLNLLYGSKEKHQKSKRSFYWIDSHGKRRKSYHKGGAPKIFIPIDKIDRVAGRRIESPKNMEIYQSKISREN